MHLSFYLSIHLICLSMSIYVYTCIYHYFPSIHPGYIYFLTLPVISMPTYSLFDLVTCPHECLFGFLAQVEELQAKAEAAAAEEAPAEEAPAEA